ncbi:hypothetical protein [Salinibacter sp.]|uniref:hypothetical protein n=1 Tax=Salinibacter sp. TaxID=2065818 RepID=UPI0021E7FE44|nr:hypothetical protein [Salinibacter sp.]
MDDQVPMLNLEYEKKYIEIALFLALSALLLWASWSPVPYEQDQMSKAAKIMHMYESGMYLDPVSGIDGYRDKLFSLYYIFSSLFHDVYGLGGFLSGNVLSAILGVISSFLIVIFIRENFGVGGHISLFVLFNIPLFIVTFSYSNEMALSFVLFISSLVVLEYNLKYRSTISGVLFAAACFSRPDASLLIPFWLTWQYLKADGKGGREILKSLAALAVFGFSYSFYVLGEIPLDASTGFKWGGNLKLTAAMMSYPFGIPTLVVSLYGAYVILLKKKLQKGIVLLATLLPALFYMGNLSSPKYLFYLVLPVAVAAAFGLQRMANPMRYVTIAFMLLFWVVSVSPFGMKFGKEGAHWYLPTADGAIPTGSYAYFYSMPEGESHRAKYAHEIENAEEVAAYIESRSDTVTLAGGINGHALKYVAVKNGYNGSIPRMRRTFDVPRKGSEVIMARRSYLWGMRMSRELAEKFEVWLDNGRIEPISCTECLFPSLVKIGNGVETDKNESLGERVIFLNEYSEGYSFIKSRHFLNDYKSLSWVKNEKDEIEKNNSAYSSEVASAYRKNVPGATVTRMSMPFRYTSFKNPKMVKNGYNNLFDKNKR